MSGSAEPRFDPSPAAADPPVTGEPAVDEVLQGLADLDSVPLGEHHDRLAQAHESLHEALNRDRPEAR